MRRYGSCFAVAAGIAVLITACGSGDTTDPYASDTASDETTPAEGAAPERADADLVVWADALRTDALQDVAAAFGEENGITIAVQTVSEETLRSDFITANTAGNGPDIVVGAHDWIGTMVQNGAIDPLSLTEADQAKYLDIALQGVTYNGQVYGLPLNFEAVALYRNTDLVAEAPATVEDLVATGTASGAANPLCLQVGELGDAYHMMPLYTSAGGYVFGTNAAGDYDPNDLGVGQTGSLTAARKIGELGAAGVLKTSITGDNAVTLFGRGECAYLVAGPWALTDVRAAGISYGLSPVPGFAGLGPAQPFTDVQAFFVASKGENKTFAESFVLDAANTPETLRALYDAEPRPPAMREVLESVTATDPDTAVFAEAAASGRILPAIPQMAVVFEPLGKAEAAIVSGADPDSTMTTAGTTIAANLQ